MANRDYTSYSDELLLKSFEQCNAQLLAIEFKTPKPGAKTDHDLMVAGLQGRIFVLRLYIWDASCVILTPFLVPIVAK